MTPAETSAVDLSYIRERPDVCHHEVTRGHELQPCDKPAVAVRIDHSRGGVFDGGEPYPVCKHHAACEMVPLRDLLGGAR